MSQPADTGRIAADGKEMRDLIDREKPPRAIWDFKLIPGGLIDVEFIAQHLRLVAPATAAETYGLSTAEALRVLGEGVLSASDLDTVLEGLRLFTELSQEIGRAALRARVCQSVVTLGVAGTYK